MAGRGKGQREGGREKGTERKGQRGRDREEGRRGIEKGIGKAGPTLRIPIPDSRGISRWCAVARYAPSPCRHAVPLWTLSLSLSLSLSVELVSFHLSPFAFRTRRSPRVPLSACSQPTRLNSGAS